MIFESKKESWPEPEKSIGRQCDQKMRGTECWEVVGPALELMQKLSPDIKRLLEDNRELLEQGEDRPRVVAFNMWMEGSKPASAQPILVFSSKSRRQRKFAKALLKQSGLLADQPNIQIKTLDKMPAVYRAAKGESSSETRIEDHKGVYVRGQSTETCGALISFGNSKLSTLTATFKVDDVWYGMSAQHVLLNYPQEPESLTPTVEFLAFDEDSDEEADDIATATSKASVSSSSPAGVDTTAFQSSEDDSVFDTPRRTSGILPTEPSTSVLSRTEYINAVPGSIRGAPIEEPLQRTRIGNLLEGRGLTDLDYELFLLESTSHQHPNRIRIPADKSDSSDFLYPRKVATKVAEGPVLVATGPTGTVKGIIMKNPHYIKMDKSLTYQEMWPVQLDRSTMPGDSGALVVNATTGDIYGHIVSGDPTSSLAYIVPAYKIFNDIEKQLGARPSFTSAVQQRPNASSREEHVKLNKEAKKMSLSQTPKAIQQRRNATSREQQNKLGKQAKKRSLSLMILKSISARKVSFSQNSRTCDSCSEIPTDLVIDHAVDDAVKNAGYAVELSNYEDTGQLLGLPETTLREQYQATGSDQYFSPFIMPEDPGVKSKAESLPQEDERKTKNKDLMMPPIPQSILKINHDTEAALGGQHNFLPAPFVLPPQVMTPQMMPLPPFFPHYDLYVPPNPPSPPPQNYSYGITMGYPTQAYPYQKPPLRPMAPLPQDDLSSISSDAYGKKDEERSWRPSVKVHHSRGNTASYDSDSSLDTDVESIFSSSSDYRDSVSHYSVPTDQSVSSCHTAVDLKTGRRRLTVKENKAVIHQQDNSLPDLGRRSRRRYREVAVIPASARSKDSCERCLANHPRDRTSSIHRRLSFSEDIRLAPALTSEHNRKELSDFPFVLRDEIEHPRLERDERQRLEIDELQRRMRDERQRFERDERQHLEVLEREWQGSGRDRRHRAQSEERERRIVEKKERLFGRHYLGQGEREDRVSKTLPIARGRDNGVAYRTEEKDQQVHGVAPDGVSSLDARSKSEPAMLSPPLSPPSPPTQLQYDSSETFFSYGGLTACPITIDSNFPKGVDDYVSSLTESDVLEESRLNQVMQDIYRLCQINMDPMSLKREVLHNSRQRLLDQWRNADGEAFLRDDYVFLTYPRRLLLDDLDNEIRLLDVPR